MSVATPTSVHKTQRIGLALSGGGFRASLFHLGVIRRLEELGIMKDVAVVSSVSGGSIIAAYYLVEMEKRLRKLTTAERAFPEKRVEIFEQIAADFIASLDHNLRTRALIFTPFFHPWLFVKTLLLRAFRAGARAELIQAEYDDWFYHQDTLDQLPSVTPTDGVSSSLMGPKLVINVTSLLSGERKSFSREPNTEIGDLKTPDRNFIRLSQVVGASSGVPVVFPPTPIRGDLFVDGGVADNQGIEGLVENKCDFLIVSDASGQMEALDTMGTSELTVYARVNDIFQFQIRDKLLSSLQEKDPGTVAFVHLYLNLKDREAQLGQPVPRISSEMIPALARMRTDLDQFSPVERECLMYHGYTLIDAVLNANCSQFCRRYPASMMRTAPLFGHDTMSADDRSAVRLDLEAGKESIFLLRTLRKYPRLVLPTYLIGFASWVAAAAVLLAVKIPMERVTGWVFNSIHSVVPTFAEDFVNVLFHRLNLPELDQLLSHLSAVVAFLVIGTLPLYFVLFWVFATTRQIARQRDLQRYRKISGSAPTLKWIEETTKTPAPEERKEMKKAAGAT